MDESRKLYEEWFHSRYDSISMPPEDRIKLFTFSWAAWQAARASIEIKAPHFISSREALTKGYTVDYSNGFGDAMDAYETAIRAAGIKVKE
ncbi:hypothetical protein [Enterobacter cloacae]|uniref:hypothetical protein n=1 Tax=Enterobacter cloacae TaxID=550 RepID=UPI0006823F0A|nr:hypothetical protein [Enterobacter cloacae]